MFEDLEINIKRSVRKTLSIYVERDGTISVLAPKGLRRKNIDEILKQKEYLIYKYRAEWQGLNRSKKNREYISGQSFMYLGRSYSLKLIDKLEKPLLLKDGRFFLLKSEKDNAKEHFINFYKEHGKIKILNRIEEFKNKIDVNPGRVRIMELQNRWASCTAEGNINFHWKCIMAPYIVLDYIVVHELIHLIHKNHTQEFWNEVDKILPKYQDSIAWLKSHGASMDL
ncbi:MAG TPA: SprT family zinc-dependent metalloprotease [Ignavibacteriaceae bacterium]|nr:SprT family zinc-dependent metalloprotease [Ignavibacteriaceae bacterium]